MSRVLSRQSSSLSLESSKVFALCSLCVLPEQNNKKASCKSAKPPKRCRQISQSKTAASTSSQAVFASANTHEISGCNFQFFRRPDTYIHESIKRKKNRVVIEVTDFKPCHAHNFSHKMLRGSENVKVLLTSLKSSNNLELHEKR